MISWNRLLAGRFRDPMVGRDLLIGGLLGVFLTLMLQLGVVLAALVWSPVSVADLDLAQRIHQRPVSSADGASPGHQG